LWKTKGYEFAWPYACTAGVAIFALAAFLAGDRLAAKILGIEACMLIGFVLRYKGDSKEGSP
jgi:hypothetical protein